MTISEVRKAIKNSTSIIAEINATLDDSVQLKITKSQALSLYKGMDGNIETAAFTMPDGRLYL